MAEILDLDAEVLSDYHREVIAWVTAACVAAGRPRRVIDVRAAGVDGRVRTVQADLDKPWPEDIHQAGLVWAANSLHHMGDPGGAVARIYAVLRPGGLVAVTEMESFPRFLTDRAGEALEERVHAAMARAREEAGMHMHEDWPARLAEAGFAIEAERRFDVVLGPPLPPAAVRYAQLSLHRARHNMEDRLSADDLAALDAIAAGIPDRDDLTIRTGRTVWLARRS